MYELRCGLCGRKLANFVGLIDIKCPRCKVINNASASELLLGGSDGKTITGRVGEAGERGLAGVYQDAAGRKR
ncbi:Com family DNA-binding transcriptional regulator [Aeromonas allosaccharophila]|uniref:Com family DNA-binding transcriptional regulator n=1 Tax=Aeromonas allosaccharophila TaxID=656 RepID=UPI003D19D486